MMGRSPDDICAHQTAGPRILLVDDNPLILKTLTALIESRTTWNVCGTATDGSVAVAMFRRLVPDVVVLDYSMPVMNGLEAALEITKIAPGVCILMFTAHESQELHRLASHAGISDVIPKFDSGRLLRAIESLLLGQATKKLA